MSDYAFLGPKWSSNVVTWSFGNTGDSSLFTGTIDSADQAVVRSAIVRWASVTNLILEEVPDATPNVDIRLAWGDVKPLGLIGQTTYLYTPGSTENFLPGVAIQLQDPTETPLTGDSSNPIWQGSHTSLYQVALHEFGHALGLDLSTDYSSVMYRSSGLHNTDLDQSDINGVQVLYGTPGSSNAQTATDTVVYRFLDTTDGTHFFTGSAPEAQNVSASRSEMKYEGVGMGAADASDPNAVAIYRFLDTAHGTHFYTASGSEKDSILATRSDLKFEGVGFYEHATQQAGDSAVYRFLDTTNGTHFYSSSPAEIASINASRPDLHMEGIAFYAPAQ